MIANIRARNDSSGNLEFYDVATGTVISRLTSGGSTKGTIPLDITSVRLLTTNAILNTVEAGVPDGNTAPSLARVNGATDKALRLAWAASGVDEIAFPPIIYPPDIDDTAPVTINVLAAMAGASDTPTLAIGYFEGVGDTNAGGNTGAVTGTTVAKYSASIAHGDIGTYPKAACITLTPAAHGTDILYVYGAWVEYTKK